MGASFGGRYGSELLRGGLAERATGPREEDAPHAHAVEAAAVVPRQSLEDGIVLAVDG